jgi:hypothetical protein
MTLPSKIELIGDVLVCQNIVLDDAQKLAVLDALRAEREACAKTADEAIDLGYGGGCYKYEIAESIRARSTISIQGSK